MVEPLFLYEVLPDIKVTRYEANKKTGHVGIDVNGTVEIIWALKKRITTVDIQPEMDDFGTLMQSYRIDGHTGNNYDLTVHSALTTYIDFTNFEEGQEIKAVVTNAEPIDPALLVFCGCGSPIKWFNNDLPEVDTNAILTFYKSNNIIYAKIEKPWVGTGGSCSCGS